MKKRVLVSMAICDRYWGENIFKVLSELLSYIDNRGEKPDSLKTFEDAEGCYLAICDNNSFGYNTQKRIVPASVTKVLTTLIAIEKNDQHKEIEIRKGDIRIGSGSKYCQGDRVTMRDAIKLLFLESSNTMAFSIARNTK